jgi:hypothetical protein
VRIRGNEPTYATPHGSREEDSIVVRERVALGVVSSTVGRRANRQIGINREDNQVISKPILQSRPGDIEARFLLSVEHPPNLRQGHDAGDGYDLPFLEGLEETFGSLDIVSGSLGDLGKYHGEEDTAVKA